jgi:putative DNA primase/helicase
MALQDLTTNNFARNRLYGKMANLFADLPDMALQNTGFFKMMTGGDSMYADVKFKDGFDFFNHAKLIFSCNKLPVAYDETDAFFRRWVFLTFPNKFEGSAVKQNILEEITTEEEMSGLLNWALEGLTRLLKNKDFTNSRKTEEIRDYYERMSSPIAAFLNDKVSEEANGRVTKQELYRAFCTYCNANKLPIMSDNIFSRKLIQSFGHKITDGQETINGKRTRVWKGINCTGCTGCTGISSLKDNFHDIHENKDINGKRCVSRAGCADVVDKILTFIPIDGINYADLRKRTPDLDEAGFERLIDQLRADGSIYEDTPGHIRKVA